MKHLNKLSLINIEEAIFDYKVFNNMPLIEDLDLSLVNNDPDL